MGSKQLDEKGGPISTSSLWEKQTHLLSAFLCTQVTCTAMMEMPMNQNG